MTISRGQMNRQLREGGGIMSLSKEGIGGGDYRGIDMGSRTGFGILKKISRGVKKVAKGVKSIAKSDVGKAALAAAAAYYAPGIGIKAQFGPGITGLKAAGLAAKNKLTDFVLGDVIAGDFPGSEVRGPNLLQRAFGAVTGTGGDKGSGFLTKGLALAGLSTFLTSKFGMSPEQAEETIANPESRALYLRRYYENLNPNAQPEEVEEFVAANVAEYMAEGGRIGFSEGESGIMKMASALLGDESDDISMQLFGKPVKDLNPDEFQELMDEIDRLMNKFRSKGPVLPPDPTQPVNPFGPKPGDFGIDEDIPIKAAMGGRMNFDEGTKEKGLQGLSSIMDEEMVVIIEMGPDGEPILKQVPKSQVMPDMAGSKNIKRMEKAKGDTASMNAMQAAGIEGLPVRQNPKGVKELDLRKTGGFIPPVGIKEKADDIPAMLSNNEFVFTADAVRGAGGGNVNVGAQRMYDTMKRLEAGGKA